jgi:hypothetical protein
MWTRAHQLLDLAAYFREIDVVDQDSLRRTRRGQTRSTPRRKAPSPLRAAPFAIALVAVRRTDLSWPSSHRRRRRIHQRRGSRSHGSESSPPPEPQQPPTRPRLGHGRNSRSGHPCDSLGTSLFAAPGWKLYGPDARVWIS